MVNTPGKKTGILYSDSMSWSEGTVIFIYWRNTLPQCSFNAGYVYASHFLFSTVVLFSTEFLLVY